MFGITFKKIWQKLSFFLWSTVIFTLLIFSSIFIPYTNSIFEDKLSSEAENIIVALTPSLKSSIITDDYSDFLHFSLDMLPSNRYFEYLVVSKKNGYSTIIEKSSWKIDTLKGHWVDITQNDRNGITRNQFSKDEVYNYSSNFNLPGIDWGVVHVGLNLDEYNENKEKIITFATSLGLITCIIVFLFALLFGKKIARPLNKMTNVAKEVAKGNYSVKCNIKTGDEIEILANTFNTMTQEISNSHAILEKKVKERTENLSEINKALEVEVEFRKKAENEVKISLAEKTTLLKEIHHRVKNNLQIISSLLYLQTTKSNNPIITEVLRDSQNRVKSMGLVHEKLYRSINLAEIEFDEYIKDLSDFISTSYNYNDIEIIYDLEKVSLSIDNALPCGLIINELISNVMKYAFIDIKNQPTQELTISLKLFNKNIYVISVKDNGVGLPQNLDIENIDSLGLKLVQNLVNQLDGSLEIKNSGGTEFVVKFKEERNQI